MAVYSPTVFTDGVTGGTTTLRDCIIAADAHPGSTIQLQAGGLYTLSLANTAGQENGARRGDLDITAAMTIVGNGATIEQTVADRVFQILAPNGSTLVAFQNLIIAGGVAVNNGTPGAAAGKTQADGGGILNGGAAGIGANLVLSNMTFYNDVARGGTGQSAAGGALYTSGATSNTVTINNVLFVANSALGGSGTAGASATPQGGTGAAAFGGAMFASGDHVTFGGSSDSFLTNQAIGGSGGRGFNAGKGGTGGVADGGAVFLQSNSVSTAASNLGLVFTNNLALGGTGGLGGNGTTPGAGGTGGTAQGGAFFAVASSSLALANAVVSYNVAQGGTGGQGGTNTGTSGNGAAAGSGGTAQGGGLYLTGVASATLGLSAVNANTAQGGTGGMGGTGSTGATASGGHGGQGGTAQGGGLFLSATTLVDNGSGLVGNVAVGGNGGTGGLQGTSAGTGSLGAGGNAGSAKAPPRCSTAAR